MAKKDFTAASTKPTYQTIIGAAQEANTDNTEIAEDTADTQKQTVQKLQNQEKLELTLEEKVIQDLKQADKQQRVNFSFTEDNAKFIKIMAKLNGFSLTEYLNVLVAAEVDRQKDVYQEAQKLIDLQAQRRKRSK